MFGLGRRGFGPLDLLPGALSTAARVALALGLLAATIVAAALCAGPTRARRAATLAVLALGAVLPWIAPPGAPFARGVVSLCIVGLTMRAWELAQRAGPVSLAARLWQCTSFFDTARARRIPRRVDTVAVFKALGYGVPTAAGLAGVILLDRVDPFAEASLTHRALRWLAGALFCYSGIEVGAAVVAAANRAFGYEPPRLHDTPVLSRTVQEFWGDRWNHPVHEWLKRFVFAPLARARRARAGALAAFVVSALFHAYFVLPPAGALAACSMLAYFTLQGVLLLAEGGLGVKRWPAALAHAWTVLAVGLPSPLFVEPMLRVLGV